MSKPDHQIKARLDQLPRHVYEAIYHHCLQATGLSHVAWGNMMRGQVPAWRFMVELCDIFEVSPRQLLDPYCPLEADTAIRTLAINS